MSSAGRFWRWEYFSEEEVSITRGVMEEMDELRELRLMKSADGMVTWYGSRQLMRLGLVK